MRKTKNNLEPAAQPWVREVENSIDGLTSVQVTIAESDRSQEIVLRSVTKALAEIREQQSLLQSQQFVLSDQQNWLEAAQSNLSTLATRVSQQNTGDSFESEVYATDNTMGTQYSVIGPDWASRALVAAGATKLTNPSNGWNGNIELIVKESPIVYTDVGNYHNVMMIGIDNMSFVPQSNPLLVNLGETKELFLRPIGIYYGAGNQTVPYLISFSFSVTWI